MRSRSDSAGSLRARVTARAPWLVGTVRRVFAIDVRALAAFRIALAGYVLLDLSHRARGIRTFYTDDGVLPGAVLANEYPIVASLSFHTLFGSVWGQAALFGLAGVAAIGLLIGTRSQLLAAGLAIWYSSLFARNPHVLYGADGLLMVSLLLGALLPIGARWGIEARPASTKSQIASLGSAALLLQLIAIYLANVWFKLRSDLWMRGEAVQNVFQLDQYAILLGPLLADVGWVTMALNWGWLFMLASSPLLLITEEWRRTLVVGAFAVAHIGMGLTMFIGLFPLILLVLLLLYLPESFWERLDAGIPSFSGWLPTSGERQSLPHLGGIGEVVGIFVLVLVLLVTLGWPVLAIADSPGTPGAIGEEYPYTLFAPTPPTDTAGFGVAITLSDGTERNFHHGTSIDPDGRSATLATDRSHLWFQYLSDMRQGSEIEHEALGAYLCRQADEVFETEGVESTVYLVRDPSSVTGGGDRVTTEVLARSC